MEQKTDWTDRELAAWLDEQLPPNRLAQIEAQLRDDPTLRQRAAALIRLRDQGGHSIGEIWQRRRLSCPSRSELGGFLLQTLTPDQADYVHFHLHTVGCRLCLANLNDLHEQSTTSEQSTTRRQRFFESSAGLLRTPETHH
ncbi:MAG: hypothetical protein RLZZ458_136 [Planctomycetota bacterium]